MKYAALITALLAAFAGSESALLMVWGTTPVPWKMQSYNGESNDEKKFKEKTRFYYILGCFLLAAAFAFSAMSAVAGFLS